MSEKSSDHTLSGTREPLRRSTEKYTDTVVKEVSEYLFREKNVYVPSDKFGVWVVPPLIVTEEEIEFVLAAIDDALSLADRQVSKTGPAREGRNP